MGISHAPSDYACPFCALATGRRIPGLLTTPEEIVAADELTLTFVASHGWPGNPGHLLVIPRSHHENLYELPDDVGAAVARAVRSAAIRLKTAFDCPGTSIRQHNEPAGDQDVWHHHAHVFPRWPGDGLYGAPRAARTLEERLAWAERLRSVPTTV